MRPVPIFKREGVVAYKAGGKCFHPECHKKMEKPPLPDDVMTQDELEDEVAFCEECHREIE